MSVNRNIAYMLFAQMGRFLVPVITFPYLTRVLGLEAYGMFAFGLALATYLGLITQFGFNLSAVEAVSRQRDDPSALARTLVAVLAPQSLLFGCLVAITLLGCWFFASDQMTWIVLCFLPNVMGNSMLIPWFHQGLEKMANVASLILLGRLLSIPFVFMLVNEPQDAWIAALLHSLGLLVAGSFSMYLAIRQNKLTWPGLDVSLARTLTRDSVPLFLTNASANLYSSSVPLLVGLVSGAASVGLYNAAQVFRNLATQLMGAIFQAIYPRALRYYQEDQAEMGRFLRRYLWLCFGLALAGASFTIVVAPQLVVLAAGEEFTAAVPVLRILILSVVLGVINNFLGVQTLIPFGYKQDFSRVVMVGGLISLMLTIPMAYYLDAVGAAGSVVLIELCILLGLWRVHRKHDIQIFAVGFKS